MREVKYWLYLFAKLMVAGGVWLGMKAALQYYPLPPPLPGPRRELFMHDMLFTFLVMGFWLTGPGLLGAIIWDQKRRCRTCLRTLIMPLTTGSWGNVVIFGRPRTEWICAHGHGTLSIDELQITGRQSPNWRPHDDNIWKELESYYQARK